MGWELDAVERPFVEQLVGLGWRYVEGDIDEPARTGRESFKNVLQEATLRAQLRGLNLRDGQPWLAFSLHKLAMADSFGYAGL